MTTAKILLDTPSSAPALGFPQTAQALADVIETSEPRFAVGIFGSWGSGKTTLMRTIATKVSNERTLAPWFNAWRYEREPHLIVPLLDTVRGGLADWAERQPEQVAQRARRVAGRIGRVVRALARGLSAEVSVPGFVRLSYSAEQTVDQLLDDANSSDARSGSLYYTAFTQLRDAFGELTRANDIDRIVVFIDDLDRCLPSSTLDVIESMKLFFDLEGFIFVVGLDQTVLERAVRSRLALMLPPGPAIPKASARRVRAEEREYVKKIFQVPYELPPMAAEQLDELLASIIGGAALPTVQVEDLRDRVRWFLDHIAVHGHVNPREIKRFINAYTLQMLVRPYLDRDTVLSVLILVFRDDWALYDILREDTEGMPNAINSYRNGDGSALEDLWPDIGSLPTDLARFLRSDQAAPLTRDDLRMYLTSVEATVHIERWLSESYILVGQLRKALRMLPQLMEHGAGRTSVEGIARSLSELISQLRDLSAGAGSDRLDWHLEELTNTIRLAHGGMSVEAIKSWQQTAWQHIDSLQEELRLLRSWSHTDLA